jgi:hypothetical protein
MATAELIRAECNNVIQKEESRLMEKYSSVPESAATDLYRSGITVGLEIGTNIILSFVELSDDQRQKLLADVSNFYQLDFIEVDI